MDMHKLPVIASVKSKDLTEADIAQAIADTELCSYQIGLKFGVSPKVVQEIGAKYLGKEQYLAKENASVARLKRRIAIMKKDGIDVLKIANTCLISHFTVRQLLADIEDSLDDIIPTGITTVVEDDEDMEDTSSSLKHVTIKYMGFELSYTTSLNPEKNILEVCKLLVGGNYVAS